MPKIITAGEILVEIMAQVRGQKFCEPGTYAGPYPSGAPAIFIDQVAKMGSDCGIIARIGDDDFGRLNVERLAGDGVDVSRILKTEDYTTGTAFVTYDLNGDRKFIYHFTHSAAGQLCPGDIDEDYFDDAEYFHIMGCSLSASKRMREAIIYAVDLCREREIKISFDPNIRPELLGIKEIERIFNRVMSVTDVLLTGENEFKLLYGENLEEQIVSLLKDGPSVIVLKNGSRGTDIYTGMDQLHCPPYNVEEVDPTGAGDCFDGAFISSLVNGKELSTAAKIASAAGALSVTKQGPMEGAAEREDVFALMDSQDF